MFDHIGFPVRHLPQSCYFYIAALAPLGITMVGEFPGGVAFGRPGRPQFWLSVADPAGPAPPRGVHIAFTAATRAEVRAFHAAALAAGGTDNGAPGPRPQYHADYYAAFVIDPDGHNVEAVCHHPEA